MKNIILLFAVILLISCKSSIEMNYSKDVEINYLYVSDDPSKFGMINAPGKIYEIEHLSKKFQLAQIDINKNGKFNEVGVDGLHIYTWNETNFDVETTLHSLKENNAIKVDQDTFSYHLKRTGQPELNISNEKDIDIHFDMLSNIPEFKITTIDGKEINFEDLRNDTRKTYIEFWGTWCTGCIQILPEIKELHQKEKDNLRIISLAFKDTKEEVERFIEQNEMNWEVAIIDDETRALFNQVHFPRGYLFNSNNEILDYDFHPDEYELVNH